MAYPCRLRVAFRGAGWLSGTGRPPGRPSVARRNSGGFRGRHGYRLTGLVRRLHSPRRGASFAGPKTNKEKHDHDERRARRAKDGLRISVLGKLKAGIEVTAADLDHFCNAHGPDKTSAKLVLDCA